MLKEEELQGLEKALRAATPAPWYDAGAYTVGWIRRGDGANIFELASGTDADLEAVVKLRNAADSLISELRSARALVREIGDRLDSLCEYECDSRTKFHTPTCMRGKMDALLAGTAAQPPPDSSAALREARRLLGQTHRDYCRQMCPGHWDRDTWVPSVHEAICQDVAHFLGNAAAQPTPSSPLDPGEQK